MAFLQTSSLSTFCIEHSWIEFHGIIIAPFSQMQKKNHFLHICLVLVLLTGIITVPGCNNSQEISSYSNKKAPTQFPKINRVGYEEGIKSELNRLLRNTSFHISEFVRENENLRNVSWLNLCQSLLLEENKEYCVMTFLRSVCAECLSGTLTSELMKLHSDYSPLLSVLSIVPSDFSYNDIENLKNFLSIGFRVERADKPLSEKWNSLIFQFRESDLTNIVFQVDKNGTIIRVAPNDPRHLKDFFIFTKTLLKGERRTDS
jgi:hypothetical protein